MEAEFLKMLESLLPTEQDVLIVSGDERGGNETLANLEGSIRVRGKTIVPIYGFTGLINNVQYLSDFLNSFQTKPHSPKKTPN